MFEVPDPTPPDSPPEERDVRLLRELTLDGFLSFARASSPIALAPLNLLIGPNGAGKSNFIEALALLAATRGDIERVIRRGGGVREWLHKGPQGRAARGRPNAEPSDFASIRALVGANDFMWDPIRYALEFEAVGARFHVTEERVWVEADQALPEGGLLFGTHDGRLAIRTAGELHSIRADSVDPARSILAQRRAPEQYPELTALGERFERIQLYREWQSGYTSPLRLPQRTDLPNDHLLEDGSNLGLILNRIQADHYPVWNDLRASMRDLLDGFEDLVIKVEAASVQVFIVDRSGRRFPAVRLSDGTLRFLCLLAILCDPTPPPLIVIEEPELGLHPDAICILPRLLREASERTQVIVTTHSNALIDAFTETPEVVVVTERTDDGTTMRRLDRDGLAEWIEQYGLGRMWSMNLLGGNRW